MTVQALPWAVQGQTHEAEIARSAMGAVFGVPVAAHTVGSSITTAGGGHGVVGSGDLAVSQNGTPNMSVNVAAGSAVVRAGYAGNITGGVYTALNDATVNVAISPADATNPRRDLVILQARDNSDGSDAAADARIIVVAGTPAASPSDPSLASYANSLVLARVAVAAGATSITTANITDLRTRAHALGGFWIGSSSVRPTGDSLHEGKPTIDTTNDRMLIVDGSGVEQRVGWYSSTGRTWVQARRVATQSIPNSTSTDISFDTEDADASGFFTAHATTGITFTVPAGAGGMYILGFRGGFASTIAGARAFVDLSVTAAATGVSGTWRGNAYGDSACHITTPPIVLAAGDTFKFTAFQASGGAVNLTGWASAVRIGV